MKRFIYNIKRFCWLGIVFVVRIIFAKRRFKTPVLKGLYYNFNGGFTSDQVSLYDLTKENKNDYLSEFDWYKSRKINYPNGKLLDNKLVCAEMLKDIVNVPQTVLKKENGVLKTGENENISAEDALEIIKKEKSMFFKPISMGKGVGVFRIDYNDEKFYIDFEEKSDEFLLEVLENKDDYFISFCIHQADYLNNIYSKTSNTIRLITVRDDDGVRIISAIQRLGTKDTIPVDNGSKGGLVAKIDIETGKLSKAKSIHNKNEYKNHPNSNNAIEGVIIPNWDLIKEKMIKVTEELSLFKFIAWDILPTNDDIFVIEANNSSGINIIQVFGGVRQKDLGDFYRKNKVIK